MGLSMGHLLIVLLIVLVLFGAGKLPRIMGDMGRGYRNFKDGLNGRDEADKIDAKADAPVQRLTADSTSDHEPRA